MMVAVMDAYHVGLFAIRISVRAGFSIAPVEQAAHAFHALLPGGASSAVGLADRVWSAFDIRTGGSATGSIVTNLFSAAARTGTNQVRAGTKAGLTALHVLRAFSAIHFTVWIPAAFAPEAPLIAGTDAHAPFISRLEAGLGARTFRGAVAGTGVIRRAPVFFVAARKASHELQSEKGPQEDSCLVHYVLDLTISLVRVISLVTLAWF